MKIEKLDKNFADQPNLEDGKVVHVPSNKVKLFGVSFDDENGFIRMPHDAAKKVSDGVSYLSMQTSGGRIAFKTDSKRIKIIVKYSSLDKMYHMPLTGQAGFSLLEFRNNKELHRFTYTLNFDSFEGYESTSRNLPGKGMRKYILYFPLYNKVGSLDLVIDKDSNIEAFNPYNDVQQILYYGSSITQGGCASRPDNSYQAMISKLNHVDFINLGFSGNCKGEKEMANYCSNIPCSAFVMAYDHNSPDVKHLSSTHEQFFKIFREKNPTTPVIFVTATNYYEDPILLETRRQVILKTYKHAIANGDKNVYFLDGKKIYPPKFRESCSVDGCHPNDLGFYFIAKEILKILRIFINY